MATIVKAYSIKAGVPLALASLAYSLAFEDDTQATQFCEYYGLVCDEERVYVDRTTFYYPDLPYIMDRAINVVELKKCISVGAAIAGGEDCLAPKSIYSNHVPENSFDARGCLRSGAADDVANVSVEEVVEEEEDQLGGPVGYEMQDNDDYEEEEEEDGEYVEEDNYNGREDYDQDDADDMNQDYDDDREEEEEDDDDNDVSDEPEDMVDADQLLFKKPSPVIPHLFRGSVKSPSTPLTTKKQSPASTTAFTFQSSSSEQKLPALPASGFSFAAQLLSNGTSAGTAPKSPVVSPSRSPFARSNSQTNAFSNNNNNTKLTSSQTPPSIGFSFAKAMATTTATPINTHHQLSKPKTPDSLLNAASNAEERQKLADIQLLVGPQTETLLKEVCREMITTTAQQVLHDYLQQQAAQCSRHGDALLADVVQEVLQEICRDECLAYHVDVYARQKMLTRAFNGWRKRSTTNRVARDRTQMTPLWMPSVPVAQQRTELESRHQQSALCDLRRYRQGQAQPVKLSDDGDQQKDNKFDLAAQVALGLANKYPQHQQLLFNLLVSIPAADEGAFGCSSYLQKWWRDNVKDVTKDSKEPWLILKEVTVNAFQSVAICVRVVVGEEEDGLMCLDKSSDDNLDGILFYLSENEASAQAQSSRRRLKAVLDKYRRTGVPVTVFNLDKYVEEEQIMTRLGMDDDRVGSVLVDPRTEKRVLKEALKEGLAFLLEHYTLPNDGLRSMQLLEMVTSTIGETLWMRLAINARVNAATGEILRHGQLVAEIYNDAVDRVVAVTCQDYSHCVDVPRELRRYVKKRSAAEAGTNSCYCHFPADWKSVNRRNAIKAFLMSLKITKFPNIEIANESFKPAAVLQEYVVTLFGPGSVDTARNVLGQMMQSLREGTSWVRPMQVLTQQLLMERLRHGRDDLPGMVVVYEESGMVRYQDTPWWLQSTVLKRKIEIEAEEVPQGQQEARKKRRVTPEPQSSAGLMSGLDDILSRANKCVERAERITLNFKQNRDALEMISSKYDDRLSRLMMSKNGRGRDYDDDDDDDYDDGREDGAE